MSSSTDRAILTVDGIVKVYGNRFTTGNIRALDDVSFELRQGEICGLVGPNGAGKSTLIKMIMGIEPKTAGRIRIDDGKGTVIGYVPEKPTFFDDLTAFDNLHYIARLNRLSDPEGISRGLLVEFGLGERGDDVVRNYSKGMKQRLSIARALVHSPKILVMDEPFSGLDPTMVIELRGHLKRLRGTGLTVLVSSHDLNEIDQVCDAIVFIESGRIIKKEEFDRGDGKVNFQLIIENPGDRIMNSLSGCKVMSVSTNGRIILIETVKEYIPAIVAAVVGAGGQIMESKIVQRTAEDMYADVYLRKGENK
ncbi:MAG: ABC transporter ATP-binding protein [Methanomassiliicoccales archaeon]|nr:ABC transporter ATP-binding protein [Methanomassiliicoccales archaeon]